LCAVTRKLGARACWACFEDCAPAPRQQIPAIPGGAERLDLLERILDYRFRDRRTPDRVRSCTIVLRGTETNTALTSNERMEFLGDSVLSLVVNDYLYAHYPERSEGELTKMKSVVVSKQVLAHLAKKIDLGPFVLVSDNAHKAA